MGQNILSNILTGAKADSLKRFSAELSSNKALREKFTTNPVSVLKDVGVDLGKDVRLGERERDLIELFADPQIAELYLAGKFDDLREYIFRRHGGLVGSDVMNVAGSAVADFDVAIEVEAVAVAVVAVAAVAIGAVDPAARLRSVEADAGILNAKITALEAKVHMFERLEAKVNLLETRIR